MFADSLVVGLDDASIGHFAYLCKQKSLRRIGRADILIACIALACEALLVTRNTKDYKLVSALKVDNWVD